MERVALVTGAARGIGAATSRALAEDGWKVVAVDRASPDPRLPYAMASEDELEALAGDGIEVARLDVTDEAALRELVAGIGNLDAVVAAAGVIAGGVPLWEMASEQVEAVLDVDLHAVIATARAAIPALLARPAPRDGRFIAIASVAAMRGLPMLSAYSAAKAGVVGLIRGLAVELRGSGVTANAVSPGSTRTPILDESARLYDLESVEEFAAQHPIERLLEPAEVAALVVWLSSRAGAAVTGANLPVDGGLSI